jgi:hypothetical protein
MVNHRLELSRLARLIRKHPRKNAYHAIQIGQQLAHAKRLVPYGKWGKWLEKNIPFSDSLACQFVKASRIINVFGVDFLQRCSIACLPMLMRRMKPETREKILALEGKKITYTQCRFAIGSSEPRNFLEPTKISASEKIGEYIEKIIQKEEFITITKSTDEDYNEESFSVVGMTTQTHATKSSLLEALATVAGDTQRKVCPSCKRELELSMFSKKCHTCKNCDRARVKKYTQARKARKAKQNLSPSSAPANQG